MREGTTLADLEKLVVQFRDARNWSQFHNPKDLALALSVEAAELLELFLWKPPAEVEQACLDETWKAKLSNEMADVAIFLLYLAHVTGIDLSAAVVGKVEANEAKYPVEKSYGSSKKYTDL